MISLSSQYILPNSRGDGEESNSKTMMRDEFLINLSKFVKNIQRTLQQIEGILNTSIGI